MCDAQTVQAVEQAIADFNRPFIEVQINELLRRGMAILYDLDLMGHAAGESVQRAPRTPRRVLDRCAWTTGSSWAINWRGSV